MNKGTVVPRGLSLRTKICYGVGHILNDLCASMWFTYLLVFLHKIVKFSNIAAGTLLLVGQVADAISTPLVGIESDKTRNFKYGRRKTWHLVGVLCVTLTFPFIFNLCITCEDAPTWALFLYYCPFIVIFQFGWASTQISHLSLIPELSSEEQEKITLNTIRYGCTVSSNIYVFCVAWVILYLYGHNTSSQLEVQDAPAFMYLVLIVVGTGLLFMIIFHLGVREPPRTCTYQLASKTSKRSASNWKKWFKEVQFYQVGILYMCTRLIVNITQVYLPMYVISTLGLGKETIAIMPLIVFSSGFVTTIFSNPIIKYSGRKGAFSIGLVVIIGTCVWMWFLQPNNDQIYGVSITLGIGGSMLLVTALTMTADLIGDNKETGAFVYGAMSFVDKLSNGIAVQLIQALHPCKEMVCCYKCKKFYREVMVFVAGGAAVIAVITLMTLWKTKIGQLSQGECSMGTCAQQKLLDNSVSVSTTLSKSQAGNGTKTKGPTIPYEPPAQCRYGSIECKENMNGSIQDDPHTVTVACKKLERASHDPPAQCRYGSIECKENMNGSFQDDPHTVTVACKKLERAS